MSLLLALLTPGGPANYTLVCDVGAYTYTGQAATLTVARRLALDAGAYTYTGQVATFTLGWRLALNAGAYVYTGNDATLTYVSGAPGAPANNPYVGMTVNVGRLQGWG